MFSWYSCLFPAVGSKPALEPQKKRGPYYCLFSNLRFLQDPSHKNKQRTPTPNMNTTKQRRPLKDALRQDIHTPKAFIATLSWME